MGTETKFNCYTENTSTDANPKVVKGSFRCANNPPLYKSLNFNNGNCCIRTDLNGSTDSAVNNSVDIADQPSKSSSCSSSSSPSKLSSVVPFVPIRIDENDVIEGAKEILKVIRPHWDISQVQFKKFTDGITNKLVGCFYTPSSSPVEPNRKATTTNGHTPHHNASTNAANGIEHDDQCSNGTTDSIDDALAATNGDNFPVRQQAKSQSAQSTDNVVLVRVYGNKTDLLIDRKAETQNFLLLHSYGLAPSLYATFKNGLAYDYVPGVTLNTDSVLRPEIWRLVARRMAETHRVVRRDDNALSLPSASPATARSPSPVPMLWKKTQSFFDLVPETFSDPDKHKRIESTFLPISRLRNEFDALYKRLMDLNSPLVFSHNDLLLGNVIYTESLGTITFIDYEYADYNFQAFDIGNHFAEFSGVDQVDYARYPKREFQFEWLRTYLQAYLDREHITADEVQRLYVQVNQFALASHIFWTIWSLIQAEHSKIDFDYVDYAYLRYNEYLARKEEFLALTFDESS